MPKKLNEVTRDDIDKFIAQLSLTSETLVGIQRDMEANEVVSFVAPFTDRTLAHLSAVSAFAKQASLELSDHIMANKFKTIPRAVAAKEESKKAATRRSKSATSDPSSPPAKKRTKAQ